jgi:hypothetical protein
MFPDDALIRGPIRLPSLYPVIPKYGGPARTHYEVWTAWELWLFENDQLATLGRAPWQSTNQDVLLWVMHEKETQRIYGYLVFFSEDPGLPYRHLLTRLVHESDAHPLTDNTHHLVSEIREQMSREGHAVAQKAAPSVVLVRPVLLKQEHLQLNHSQNGHWSEEHGMKNLGHEFHLQACCSLSSNNSNFVDRAASTFLNRFCFIASRRPCIQLRVAPII